MLPRWIGDEEGVIAKRRFGVDSGDEKSLVRFRGKLLRCLGVTRGLVMAANMKMHNQMHSKSAK